MKALVIGGAGFIGSHLVDALVSAGHAVTVLDDLSSGRRENVPAGVEFIQGDVTFRELAIQVASLVRPEIVFHLAANPDARKSLTDTALDLRLGTIATANALEASRVAGVRRFVLASSGTVYGDVSEPQVEDRLTSLPISLYGASKLASEALVSAYGHSFGMGWTIFRFANVVGSRQSHGCIVDFLAQGNSIRVLGNGRQEKGYLHVSDCVRGVMHLFEQGGVFNLAPVGSTTVRDIARMCSAGGRIEFGQEDRGWPGDVPVSDLDAVHAWERGWEAKLRSTESVARAIEELR